MTQWANSLIRISGYEVETLQKRLSDIVTRRSAAEMRIAVLDAEMEVERTRAGEDSQAALLMPAYTTGWKIRRAIADGDLAQAAIEEDGARDALARAFEELKKFEHVAEVSRLARVQAEARAETAAFDELAGRRKKKKA
jgi:flagellar export protein FliJ